MRPYILSSDVLEQYYIGHTSGRDDRLYRHINSGKSTKKANDCFIEYSDKKLFNLFFASYKPANNKYNLFKWIN